MNKLCAVIVTYNRLLKLKETLRNTLKQDFNEIVVVNNASTDGTTEWLQNINDLRLKVINLSKNIGGSGGFYEGFKYVLEHSNSDWLVCYDDDAYPEKELVSKFKTLNIREDINSIAAAVYLPDGNISPMNIPRFNPFYNFKIYLEKKYFFKNSCVDIDMSSFVGYFLRIKNLRKENILPNKDLFIYADDLIYSYQWKKKGYKHIFNPNLKFYHDTETLNSSKGKYYPIWKIYFTYRNGIELYREMLKGSHYLYALLKFISLYKDAKYYSDEDKKIYKKLLKMAFYDGIKRNFTKGLEELLE